MELKAVAKLGCYNFGTPPPFPPPLVLADTITTTLTMNVETRNRATVFATHEEAGTGYVQPPVAPQYSYAALQGAMSALDILDTFKHSVVPSQHTELNEVVGENVLLSYLREDNLLFAFTHGTVYGFKASYTDQDSGNGDEMLEWSEILAVGRNTTTGRNLALLYACSAFGGGSSMASALGITGPGRGVAGFNVVVWSAWSLSTQVDVLLSNHSTLVMVRLVAGDTLQEAVDHANNVYKPVDPFGTHTDMIVGGDSFTRTHFVYAEDSAKLNQWRNAWFALP